MINVSELLADPDFAQSFTVRRSSGQFALGGFESTTTTLTVTGVIRPAGEREIQMVPEGDRVTGMIAVHTASPLYQTHAGAHPGLSDVIVWRGEPYRILKLFPYSDFGYTKAIAARTGGN